MHRAREMISIATALTFGWTVADGNAAAQVQSASETSRVIAHQATVSNQAASLQFQLANGDALTVTLEGGRVDVEWVIGHSKSRQVSAEYERGGELEMAWNKLVAQGGRLNTQEMLSAVQRWRLEGLGATDEKAFGAVTSPFANLVALETPVDINYGAPHPQTEAGSGVAEALANPEVLQALEALKTLEELGDLERLKGLAGLEGVESLEGLEEALRALETSDALEDLESLGEIQPGTPAVPTAESRSPTIGSMASQLGGDLLGLLATFVALSALGFGLVFFAPRQLEIVADTVHHSFWRSFLVGLFAQPLIIPVFGMLLLGLALTVIGVVIIPFATVGFVVAIGLAITGGYLAVARSVGEAYLRQRMSRGYAVGSWLSYRYIVYGLVALLALWLPAVLLGSVPVAGDIAAISAAVLTWMLATAGFGATLLSRAGIRGTFARSFNQALSDEYLYQTPQATPIVRKHERISKS